MSDVFFVDPDHSEMNLCVTWFTTKPFHSAIFEIENAKDKFMNKLILQVPPNKMGKAMMAAQVVQRQNPQQKVGERIKYENTFVVIKNRGSYTVKEQ